MEKTTGELSMTIVVIIGIVAIGGIIALLRDPIIDFIENQWANLGGQAIDLNGNNNNG